MEPPHRRPSGDWGGRYDQDYAHSSDSRGRSYDSRREESNQRDRSSSGGVGESNRSSPLKKRKRFILTEGDRGDAREKEHRRLSRDALPSTRRNNKDGMSYSSTIASRGNPTSDSALDRISLPRKVFEQTAKSETCQDTSATSRIERYDSDVSKMSPLVLQQESPPRSERMTVEPRFAASLEEEEGKIAVVSDGQTPDLFETSTTTSSSLSLDNISLSPTLKPVATRRQDIPRQIETPTKEATAAAMEAELDERIPRKSAALAQSEEFLTIANELRKQGNLGEERPSCHEMRPPASLAAEHSKAFQPKAEKKIVKESATEETPRKKNGSSEARKINNGSASKQSASTPDSSGSDATPNKTAKDSPESVEQFPLQKHGLKGDDKLVQVGARVAVYWDGEDAFFEAKVTKERPHKKKRFFLEYDDGDQEWINLRKNNFQILSGGKPNRDELATVPDSNDPKSDLGKDELTEHSKDSQSASPVSDTAGEVANPGKKLKKKTTDFSTSDWIHDNDWVSKGAKRSESDSETDDDEVMRFACEMFGVEKPPAARPKQMKNKLKAEPEYHPEEEEQEEPKAESEFRWEDWGEIHIPISEKVKLGRRRNRVDTSDTVKLPKKKKSRTVLKASDSGLATPTEVKQPEMPAVDPDQESRRKKEEARTLTPAEIEKILGEDAAGGESSHWVRRSARMPSASVLTTPKFKLLIENLKSNALDMVVLKMKKYVGDLDCPPVVIDAVLDALEENSNCQSLYIQNFNEGMRDAQVLRLVEILRKPSCQIWCLNIGETYKVKSRTWKIFARGLRDSKVTHMYASEHTISSELKDKIRATIRNNRSKHNMHIDPENLDVIVQCTHCWWNPVNAKLLQPHLHKKGYAQILNDNEAQGLRGTMTGATLT